MNSGCLSFLESCYATYLLPNLTIILFLSKYAMTSNRVNLWDLAYFKSGGTFWMGA